MRVRTGRAAAAGLALAGLLLSAAGGPAAAATDTVSPSADTPVEPQPDTPPVQPEADTPAPAPDTPPPSRPTARPGPTTSPPRPAPPRPRTPSTRRIELALGGDVHFEGPVETRLARAGRGQVVFPGLTALLGPVRASDRQAARPTPDVVVLNLETAVTQRGSARPSKEYSFRGPASGLAALRAAGARSRTVVSLANNHGMDYGPVGLSDTLAAARAARLPLVGAGQGPTAESDAYAPVLLPVRAGARTLQVAVLGATDVLDSASLGPWTARGSHAGLASAKRVPRLLQAVRAARARASVVVVAVHWGKERALCPTVRQRDLARALVAAGADVVVGSHPHVLQGAGTVRAGGRTGHVAYSLGNLVWYARPGSPGSVTGILRLALDVPTTGRRPVRLASAQLLPARITGGDPVPVTGRAAASAQRHWASLRGCAGF